MKLIDVDALKAIYGMGDECKDCKRSSRSCRYNTIYTMMDFCGLIDEAPIVDAVPVVRCKDCKFSDWYTAMDGNRYCYCMEHGSSGHEENDFCSYGEKDGDKHEDD